MHMILLLLLLLLVLLVLLLRHMCDVIGGRVQTHWVAGHRRGVHYGEHAPVFWGWLIGD